MSDLPHYLSIIMHYQSWWIGHFVHGGFWLYGLNDNPEQELRSSLIIIDICSLFFIFLPGLIFITLLYLSGRKKPGVYRTDVDLVAALGKSFVQSSWISYSAELLPSPLCFFFYYHYYKYQNPGSFAFVRKHTLVVCCMVLFIASKSRLKSKLVRYGGSD